ncbi:malto-oligosyltrehalose synthase [Desulfurivibrio sp. C05AmB]|jgi:(1->4)-alpha-D-glucan 1-alpha-D-glucosylmutase|uniref:malto-oligosyltrehalose synthase n=1 Tax=Desulfurivibrio sp. C05AmB TaxID=3374371 RepID=UPI00376F3FA7
MPRRRIIPRATYRLQFHRDFNFADATALVPYLAELGISHCYASPILKARPGSRHGYDIVDHRELNPELGDRAAFKGLVERLRDYGMGLIVDIVPNHMGVGGADNAWWQDVLENGPAAEYASFFDIDWRPAHEVLQGKVLLPILGDRYGNVLDRGEIKLAFSSASGTFHFAYYEHQLPLDPATYPAVAALGLEAFRRQTAADDPALLELENLLTAFAHLPGRGNVDPQRGQERRRDKEITKQRLADLCRREPRIAALIERCVALCNDPADRGERLHALLEKQVYRLAHWVVAGDEINYRRFFDINSLAGLRAEREEVFQATHGLLLELVAAGQIEGLRVDHPDGLSDPAAYFVRLHEAVTAASLPPAAEREKASPAPAGSDNSDIYLVVEKILASYEYLPEQWRVDGTTGYDFANQVNGLFTRPEQEAALTRVYHRFIGRRLDFDDLLYERKKLIVTTQLSSELTVLARLLKDIAEGDRHTRDFTLNGLRDALIEVTACFPVYRTYIRAEPGGATVSPEDRNYVEWAVAQARKRGSAIDPIIYDFLQASALAIPFAATANWAGGDPPDPGPGPEMAVLQLRLARMVRKFQQYTAPVMAKALEDTTFYIANRLVSLNEVGGDPRRFHVSPAALHHAAQDRLRRWPHAMLATSTHDSKRSEDVRARINVISEVPELWRRQLQRWRRWNRSRKSRVNHRLAPSPDDEYLFYQTLLGSWPLAAAGEPAGADDDYRRRLREYMLKATREAKVHTSWLNPDPAYEEATARFVDQVLDPAPANPFPADFAALVRRLAPYGLLNSLAQLLLKLTSPGVPDIYQGSELWDFSLVDPDNRRPVDYRRRRRLLATLPSLDPAKPPPAAEVRALLTGLGDGRLKLYLIGRILRFRRQLPELFQEGTYQPLAVEGPRQHQVCAFIRQWREHRLLVAVGRWFASWDQETVGGGAAGGGVRESEPGSDSRFPRPPGERFSPDLPLFTPAAWGDTTLVLPEEISGAWHNLLVAATIEPEATPGGRRLRCAEAFAHLPVTVLYGRATS